MGKIFLSILLLLVIAKKTISVLLDTNDYINNTINNKIKEDSSSYSPAAKLYNVLFEDMLKEYNKLIDMEEETSDRLSLYLV